MMTIRLIKRDQMMSNENQAVQTPPLSQVVETTQAWVEEFKARKASPNKSLSDLAKRL
jgi:hypothetical protein